MASIRWPSTNGINRYATFADFPDMAADGQAAVALDTDILYIFNLDSTTWVPVGGGSVVLTVGTIDSVTPSVNGAVISSNDLIMQSASATRPGLVNTTTQSFAGDKTFTNVFASIFYDNSSGAGSAGGVGPIRLKNNHAISWQNFGDSADFTLKLDGSNILQSSAPFNSAGNITGANLSGTNTGNVTLAAVGASANANGASLSGQVLTLQPATTSFPGVLTASDWNTFNGKQAAGNYITALTGNITASGPGSVAATIANNVITNAMINSAAAIAYSKLALSNSIVNADIATGAAIDFSKLATLASANILVGSGGGVATSVAMSGDITITNAGVTAVGSNKITNAMLAQVATATFKGRTTAGTGNAEDLTATQATALLNAMVGDSGSGGTKGLVPAPASGDAAAGKFLKADGTWATPTAGSIALANTHILVGNGSNIAADVAMSGDITIGNTGVTAIGANKVLDTMIRQSAGLSLIGRSASTTGNVADITSGAADRILRADGTNASIGFGSIDLSKSGAVGSSILPIANGGTNAATATAAFDALSPMSALGDLIYGGASGTRTRLAGSIVAAPYMLLQTGNGSVSAAPVWTACPRSTIWVYDHAAYGATATKIPTWSTVGESTGTDITLNQDATNGWNFVINTAGVYAINFGDAATTATDIGISLNSAQLTTNVSAITASTRLAETRTVGNDTGGSCGVTLILAINDVIRPHTNGSTVSTSADYQYFRITKVSN